MQVLGVILFIFREPIFCNKYTHTHSPSQTHTCNHGATGTSKSFIQDDNGFFLVCFAILT